MDGLRAQRAFETTSDDQHGGAMHERPDREHQAGMFAGCSSKALRQALAHEIERGPWLVQRRRFADGIEKDFIGVGVSQREFEVALDGVAESASTAEGSEERFASLQPQCSQDVVAVTIALVDRGRGGSGGFRDSPHGEGFFAAAGPHA